MLSYQMIDYDQVKILKASNNKTEFIESRISSTNLLSTEDPISSLKLNSSDNPNNNTEPTEVTNNPISSYSESSVQRFHLIDMETRNKKDFDTRPFRNHEKYAFTHGYTINHIFYNRVPSYKRKIDNLKLKPIYTKMLAILEAINHEPEIPKWIWMMDGDLIVMNETLKLDRVIEAAKDIRSKQNQTLHDCDFIIGEDCNGINAGSFFIKNTEWSREFMNRVLEYNDPNTNWAEQQTMNIIISNTSFSENHVTYIHMSFLNSYVEGICGDHDYSYKPGDFVIHFPSDTTHLNAYLDMNLFMNSQTPDPKFDDNSFKEAYFTMLTSTELKDALKDENFLTCRSILYRLLKHPRTRTSNRDIIVYVTDTISEKMRDVLISDGAIVKVIEPIHLTINSTNGKIDLNYLKLHLWKEIEYDSVFYIDSNALIMKNLDDAFEYSRSPGFEFLAAQELDSGLRELSTFTTSMMLIKPNLTVFETILENVVDKNKYHVDSSEQGLLNWVYRNKRERLPREYYGSFVAAELDENHEICRTIHEEYWKLDDGDGNSGRIRRLYELAFKEFNK